MHLLLELSPTRRDYYVIGCVESGNSHYDINNDALRNFLRIYNSFIPPLTNRWGLLDMYPDKYIVPAICSLFPFSVITLIEDSLFLTALNSLIGPDYEIA